MLNVEKEGFTLQKIKLLPGAGVYAECRIQLETDGATHEIGDKITNPIVPAEDLTDPIRGLKEKLLYACGFTEINTMIGADAFKATAAQKKAVKVYLDILLDKTIVTGVTLVGSGEKKGMIIMGKITAANAGVVAVNTPLMRYSSEVFGFEQELEEVEAVIVDETFQYLWEGKKMQMDAFSKEQMNPSGDN